MRAESVVKGHQQEVCVAGVNSLHDGETVQILCKTVPLCPDPLDVLLHLGWLLQSLLDVSLTGRAEGIRELYQSEGIENHGIGNHRPNACAGQPPSL
jgi:hypothetical protein